MGFFFGGEVAGRKAGVFGMVWILVSNEYLFVKNKELSTNAIENDKKRILHKTEGQICL